MICYSVSYLDDDNFFLPPFAKNCYHKFMRLQSLIRLLFFFSFLSVLWLSGYLSRLEEKPLSADSDNFYKKGRFISWILPRIQEENRIIENQRRYLGELYNKFLNIRPFNASEKNWLVNLAKDYRIEPFNINEMFSCGTHWEEMTNRVDVIPVSLVVAQAAIESGWGTSRFTHEGNNLFGQRCKNTGCGIVPKNRKEGESYEVQSFSSVGDSIRSYMLNLNSHEAYSEIRRFRKEARSKQFGPDGRDLARGLVNYSELGEKYANDVIDVIEQNRLGKYDDIYYFARK